MTVWGVFAIDGQTGQCISMYTTAPEQSNPYVLKPAGKALSVPRVPYPPDPAGKPWRIAMIDVTNSSKTFGQLAQELNVNKFGVLTQFPGEEPGFSYIGEMETGRFAWSAGYGEIEPQPPHFNEQTGVSPRTVQSLMIEENGNIVVGKVLKVLAYDD